MLLPVKRVLTDRGGEFVNNDMYGGMVRTTGNTTRESWTKKLPHESSRASAPNFMEHGEVYDANGRLSRVVELSCAGVCYMD